MKVAVVGKSASGLLAALELAHQGAEVYLFVENEPNSGKTPLKRLLIVTSKIAEEEAIKELGLFQDGSFVRNQIRCFELLANGAIARIELRQPDVVIEREDLFQVLKKRLAPRALIFFTAIALRDLLLLLRRKSLLLEEKPRIKATLEIAPATSRRKDGMRRGKMVRVNTTVDKRNCGEQKFRPRAGVSRRRCDGSKRKDMGR